MIEFEMSKPDYDSYPVVPKPVEVGKKKKKKTRGRRPLDNEKLTHNMVIK